VPATSALVATGFIVVPGGSWWPVQRRHRAYSNGVLLELLPPKRCSVLANRRLRRRSLATSIVWHVLRWEAVRVGLPLVIPAGVYPRGRPTERV